MIHAFQEFQIEHCFEFTFCWMFFQRKELRQNNRRLIPECCRDHCYCIIECYGRLFAVNYDGDDEDSDTTEEDDFYHHEVESSSELSMLASVSNSVGLF